MGREGLGAGESVYEASEDTWLLEVSLLKLDCSGLAIDVGCGGGDIALTLLKRGGEVVALDISEEAVRVTARRSAQNSWRLHVMVCDRLAAIRPTGRISVIACNPPYLPSEEPADRAVDGGPSGADFSLELISQARPFLDRGARLVLITSTLGGEDAILEACKKIGLRTEMLGSRRLFFEELRCYLVVGRDTGPERWRLIARRAA